MNKQELINRYTEKLLTQSNSLSQAVQESRNAIFRNVIADLELLDEPQKVKVPKCLAAYIDYSKSRGGDSVEEIFSPAWVSENDEVYNWLYDNSEDENDHRYLLAVRAYVEGDYEVEEEPKYYIQLPETTWGTYLVKGEDNALFVWQNTDQGTPFTEQEIKAIDERYWPFAVPVEKV